MDEARKFLRYIVPGLIFGTLTLLWLFIVDLKATWSLLLPFIKESPLGAVLSSVLMSGGLGYIFATIHHTFHRLCKSNILDHSPLIKSLKIETCNREDALVISTALWCQFRDKNCIGDATYKKLESFGNQTHALGTAFIASIFALVVATIFCFTEFGFSISCVPTWPFIFMYVPGILVIWMFYCSYRSVGIFAQDVYDWTFRKAYDEYLNIGAN